MKWHRLPAVALAALLLAGCAAQAPAPAPGSVAPAELTKREKILLSLGEISPDRLYAFTVPEGTERVIVCTSGIEGGERSFLSQSNLWGSGEGGYVYIGNTFADDGRMVTYRSAVNGGGSNGGSGWEDPAFSGSHGSAISGAELRLEEEVPALLDEEIVLLLQVARPEEGALSIQALEEYLARRAEMGKTEADEADLAFFSAYPYAYLTTLTFSSTEN